MTTKPSKIEYISSYEEFKTLINEPDLTVIDFTASWCGPCKVIGPEFEKLHAEFPDANFAKIDVDDVETQGVCNHCHIKAMPTFIFFRNGEILNTIQGANKVLLKETIAKFYSVKTVQS